jgi:hypothetical protein
MNNGHREGTPLFYRQLPQTEEDWTRFREFMKHSKGFIPPARLGVAAIADTMEGEIVAGLVLQMVPYLGPYYIAPKWRGHVDPKQLTRVIDSTFTSPGPGSLIIQGYVAMTSDEAVARIAEGTGMTRLENCITLIRNIDKDRPIPTLD